jgi:hypothetical protein
MKPLPPIRASNSGAPHRPFASSTQDDTEMGTEKFPKLCQHRLDLRVSRSRTWSGQGRGKPVSAKLAAPALEGTFGRRPTRHCVPKRPPRAEAAPGHAIGSRNSLWQPWRARTALFGGGPIAIAYLLSEGHVIASYGPSKRFGHCDRLWPISRPEAQRP